MEENGNWVTLYQILDQNITIRLTCDQAIFFLNRLIVGYHSPNSARGRDTRELSRIFRLFWIPKRMPAEIKLPKKILAKIFPPKTIPKSKISSPQNPSISPVTWNPEIADIGLLLHFNMSAKEETIEAASFGALEEAVDFMKKAHELMNQQALDLRQEKEAFESVAKKLDHVHFASTIKLNVGGHYFTTSLQTLTKDRCYTLCF